MRIFAVFFSIIILFAATPTYGQQYYDEENKYRFTPPVDWTIVEYIDPQFGKVVLTVSNEEFEGQNPPLFMIIRFFADNLFSSNFLEDKPLQENFVKKFVRIGLQKDQVQQIKIDKFNPIFDEENNRYIFEIHGEIIQEDSLITKYSAVGYILETNEILGLVYYSSPEDYYHSYSKFFESVESFQYEERMEMPKIPEWIRSNAQWWSDGQINDQDFLLGIQYLIKQNIMKIPDSKNSQTDSLETVPNWVKDTAGWWAQGKVSDDEFVNGIKFLIEKGIIVI